jgi:hypothetical protein
MTTKPQTRALLRAAACALAAAAVTLPCLSTSAADTLQLQVPKVTARVKLNGDTQGKPYWDADTGVTRNFRGVGGQGMVPYSEAKVRWGNGSLYLLLYAGDLDLEGRIKKRDAAALETDDSFHLEFGSGDEVRVISVSILGTITDSLCTQSASGRKCDASWDSGARLAIDRDGSLNKIGDNDEEWVVEMSIPLAKLGLKKPAVGAHIPFSIRRCEIGHDGPHACGGWGQDPPGELVLAR